ncbi:hypothetical protein CR513_59307, partial [Mucuna pruriens]
MCYVVNTSIDVSTQEVYASLYDNRYSLKLKSDDIFLAYKHPLHIYDENEFDIPSLVLIHDSMHALHMQKYQNNKFVFLGFVIGFKGIKVVAKKVKATPSWLTPKSMRNVKSFHGIVREVIRLHKPLVSKETPSSSITIREPCRISLALSYSFLLPVIP